MVQIYVGHLSSKYFFRNILDVCNELTLSSTGPAGYQQSAVMGKFLKVDKRYDERSVWKKYKNSTGESEWIYFIKEVGVWHVSFWVCSNESCRINGKVNKIRSKY